MLLKLSPPNSWHEAEKEREKNEEGPEQEDNQGKQSEQDHQEKEVWEYGNKQDSGCFRRDDQQEDQQEEVDHRHVMTKFISCYVMKLLCNEPSVYWT